MTSNGSDPIGVTLTVFDNSTKCYTGTMDPNCTTATTSGTIWTPDVIQRVASLVFIMTLTLVGNTVIIIVLTCSRYRKRNSRVNIFIINLAIGDLAVCFCTMTTEILFVAFGEWVLGSAGCKLLTYMQIITLASTTFILTAMSFDRYMAICKPLSYRATTSRAKRMIAIAWIMAFIFAIPQLLIFVQTVDGVHPDGRKKYGCRSRGYTANWQRKVYFTFMTLYILVIPAILISYFYINLVLVVWRQGKVITGSKDNCPLRRSIADKKAIPRAKIKTIKMTFTIIASFIVCWTPYFVTTLIRIYSNYTHTIPAAVVAFVETLALFQSALNPLWYGFFNIKLKRGLMEVFCPSKLIAANRGVSFKSNGLTECMSVTEEYQALHANKRHSGRYRENSSTSSSGSHERLSLRSPATIITEENKNGFKLRVRFAIKDSPKLSEHCSVLCDNGDCRVNDVPTNNVGVKTSCM